MMVNVVYCAGHFIPKSECSISVDNRAFRFGEGVFETMRVHRGRIEYWDAHMQRLQQAEQLLGLKISDAVNMQNIAQHLLAHHAYDDAVLRIIVSGAGESHGYRPLQPEKTHVYMEVSPLSMPTTVALTLGLAQWRRIPAQCLPVEVKTTSALNVVLAAREAQAQRVDDVILLDIHDAIAEASAGSLFWCRNGVWHTPALEGGALDAVARRFYLHALQASTGYYPLTHLQNAEHVLHTNALYGARQVQLIRTQQWQQEYALHTHIPTMFD